MQTNLAKLPYLLLAILAAGSSLFYVASTAAVFDSFLNANRARPPLEYSHNARFLVQPLPESRRAGMQAVDEILSVNGVPFTGMAGLIRQTFHAHPGQIVAIVYRNQAGGMHTAQVELMAQRRAPPTFSGWLINIVLVLLFPAFCLLLGYWVVLARPLDWNAWFLLGIMNVAPAFIARTGYFPGFLDALHYLLADLRLAMDVHLSHPVQHLLSRPLPYRHSLPVDQVARHHSPDPDRSLQLRS